MARRWRPGRARRRERFLRRLKKAVALLTVVLTAGGLALLPLLMSRMWFAMVVAFVVPVLLVFAYILPWRWEALPEWFRESQAINRPLFYLAFILPILIAYWYTGDPEFWFGWLLFASFGVPFMFLIGILHDLGDRNAASGASSLDWPSPWSEIE